MAKKKSPFSPTRQIDAERLRHNTDAEFRAAKEMKELARRMRNRAIKMRVESELARRPVH